METIGSRIFKLRKAKKLSRRALGEMIDLNYPSIRIAKYENDKKYPRMQVIENIANSLNVSKEYLLTGTLDLKTYQNMSYDEILFDIYDVSMLRLMLGDMIYFIRGLHDDLLVYDLMKPRNEMILDKEKYDDEIWKYICNH